MLGDLGKGGVRGQTEHGVVVARAPQDPLDRQEVVAARRWWLGAAPVELAALGHQHVEQARRVADLGEHETAA